MAKKKIWSRRRYVQEEDMAKYSVDYKSFGLENNVIIFNKYIPSYRIS